MRTSAAFPAELAPLPWDEPRYGLVRSGIGRFRHWRHRIFEARRHRGYVVERVAGLTLLVAPGVLNPRLMRTGEYFAQQLGPRLIPARARVLDMGTGSGVCALVAARHAGHVAAVDISAQAVRCARINVLMNHCEERVRVIEGDLFAPLGGDRFDAILFNPPFLHGVPRDDADRAWRSTDVPERFAAGLADHLTPNGYALVLLSSYGGAGNFVREFRRRRFSIEVLTQRDYVNERLTLLKIGEARVNT